jgi:hypothetical protein
MHRVCGGMFIDRTARDEPFCFVSISFSYYIFTVWLRVYGISAM